ncbi:MAG: OmpH family outer membrane protein [bacterium]|nr:OmpH family outer membrane protein [bacterium]
MFGKNSAVSDDPQNKNLTTDEKINLSEDNFKLEDFPIHTMKEDLKELQNPSTKKEIPLETIEPKKTFSFDTKPQADSLSKNGPFFNQETPVKEKPTVYKSPVEEQPLYFNETKEIPQEKNSLASAQKKIPTETKKQESSQTKPTGFFSFLKTIPNKQVDEKNPENSFNLAKQNKEEFQKKNTQLQEEISKKEKELNEKIIAIKQADEKIQEALNKKQALDSEISKEELTLIEERKTLDNLSINKNNLLKELEKIEKEKQSMKNSNSFFSFLKTDSEVAPVATKNNKAFPEALERKNYPDQMFNVNTAPHLISKEPQNKNILPNDSFDKKINSTPKKEYSPEDINLHKIASFSFLIFVIIIASAGGYYFWMTRLSTPSEQNIITAEPETILPEEKTETTSVLSSQNSNYLQIDLTQATTENLKQTLGNYATKVLATNEIGVFEFLITDETNTPVTFQDFAETLGLKLTSAISAQIGQDFSLYIYNYGDKTRFGLLLTTLNDNLMKTALAKEEKNLPVSLSPLYPTITAPAISTFSSTTYKNHAVRYANITSADDYAIDYATIGNKLVIGTTKTTLFSSLDRLSE